MTDTLPAATLRRIFEEARDSRNDFTDRLSQEEFLAQQQHLPGWALGPFARDSGLDFTLSGQWPDPSGIGWTSSCLFNPSLITRGDELHLFYRASPRKESLSSRIGHAVHTPHDGWRDNPANPVVYPTLGNEVLGVEDPKVYRDADGRYVLFYNAIFATTVADRERYPSPGYLVEDVGCDISVAVSTDLATWTKRGPITDRAVSRLWAKGAVIPRAADGTAVRIDGQYLMYTSEGFNGVQHIGRSPDLRIWQFEPCTYLDLTPLGGQLHEVATAVATDDGLVLDFFYRDATGRAAGQAFYRYDRPFQQVALNRGGTLAWGGLVQQHDRWLFAQGWDAPPGSRALQFYTAPIVARP